MMSRSTARCRYLATILREQIKPIIMNRNHSSPVQKAQDQYPFNDKFPKFRLNNDQRSGTSHSSTTLIRIDNGDTEVSSFRSISPIEPIMHIYCLSSSTYKPSKVLRSVRRLLFSPISLSPMRPSSPSSHRCALRSLVLCPWGRILLGKKL